VKIDNKMILFGMTAAAATTMSISIQRNPAGAAIVGQATRYLWNRYSVSPAELFDTVGNYVWQVSGRTYTFVMTEGSKYPRAVVAVIGGAIIYYKSEEVKRYASGIAGIGLIIVAAGIAYQYNDTKRRRIK
jgi:hypothetical protein